MPTWSGGLKPSAEEAPAKEEGAQGQPVAWLYTASDGSEFASTTPPEKADAYFKHRPLTFASPHIPADVVRGLERRLADAMDLPTVAVIARDAIAALKESSRVAERGGKPEEKTND